MKLDACENCGRTIGKLETAHIHDGHIVCADCIRRLEAAVETKPTQAVEKVLFRHGDLSVTTVAICNAISRYPLEYVLSVRPTRKSFSFVVNVEVIDLARGSRTYRLPARGKATEFIRAIQAAKGSINVESEDVGGFFVIW